MVHYINSKKLFAAQENDITCSRDLEFAIRAHWAAQERLGDLHSLDITTMAWRLESPSGQAPSPRAGHTAILLDPRPHCWGVDVKSEVVAPVAGPGNPLLGGGPGPDSRLEEGAHVLIFGGADGPTVLNDMHVLDVGLLR